MVKVSVSLTVSTVDSKIKEFKKKQIRKIGNGALGGVQSTY